MMILSYKIYYYEKGMTVLKNISIISLVCMLSFIYIITLNNNISASELTSKSSYMSSSKNSSYNNAKCKISRPYKYNSKKPKNRFNHYSKGFKCYLKKIKVKIIYFINDICRFLQYSF